MKKRLFGLLLGCIIALCLITVAFADESISVNCTLDEQIKANIANIEGGMSNLQTDLPDGLGISSNGTSLTLEGFAPSAGNLNYYVSWDDDSGSHSVNISINATIKEVTLPEETYYFQSGDVVDLRVDNVSTGGKVTDLTVKGNLPKELKSEVIEIGLLINGTAESHGTFRITLRAYDEKSRTYRILPVALSMKAFPIPTKQPTSEEIDEGGTAEYVAWAKYLGELRWYFTSPDGKSRYMNWNIKNAAPGLDMNITMGKLSLKNVPLELDGWRVTAEFCAAGGSVMSEEAKLTVHKLPLQEPVITSQPKGADIKADESTVLSVSAEGSKNGELSYQWYKNTKNSSSGGTAIDGATDASYSPDVTPGSTTYYYCVVKNSRSGEVKQVTSEVVELKVAKIEASPKPSESPEPEDELKPSEAPKKEEAKPNDEQKPNDTPNTEAKPNVVVVNEQEKDDESSATLTVLVVLAVLAVIAGLVCVLLRRNEKHKKHHARAATVSGSHAVYTGSHSGAHTAKPRESHKHLKK